MSDSHTPRPRRQEPPQEAPQEQPPATPGVVALLVDFDNLYLGLTGTGVRGVTPDSTLQALNTAIEPLGALGVARVFAPNPAQFKDLDTSAAAHGFDLVAARQARWAGRSGTDVLMVMQGQELLFTRPDITTFVLASGDSDFAPLAQAIIDRGKRLIVLCPSAVASTALTSIAHEFIALEPLIKGTPPPRSVTAASSTSTSQPQPPGSGANSSKKRPRSRSKGAAGSGPGSGPTSAERPSYAALKRLDPAAFFAAARAIASGPAPRKLRVFLCHSKHDKPAVRRLYARLLEEEGIEPWLDEKNLLPGQDWKLEITRQVKKTDCVLVCLSKRAIEGVGFVHTEIGFAVEAAQRQPEGAIFLIPVKFEECDLPESLARFHWVNLFDEDGHTLLMRALRTRADAVSR